MINLLPPGQKQIVEKEYKFRLGSAYILLMSIVVVIGVVLLLPSYFFVDTRESVAESELSTLQSSSESTEREAIREELLLTKKYLGELTKDEARAPLYTVIDKVSIHSDKAINISTVSYTRVEVENISTLSVGGVAPTRDALLGFKRALEEDELFDEVVLPVSSLAKDEDIDFNIQIKGVF